MVILPLDEFKGFGGSPDLWPMGIVRERPTAMVIHTLGQPRGQRRMTWNAAGQLATVDTELLLGKVTTRDYFIWEGDELMRIHRTQPSLDDDGQLDGGEEDYYDKLFTWRVGRLVRETTRWANGIEPVAPTTWEWSNEGRRATVTGFYDKGIAEVRTLDYDEAGRLIHVAMDHRAAQQQWTHTANWGDDGKLQSVRQTFGPDLAPDGEAHFRWEGDRLVAQTNPHDPSVDLWTYTYP